MKSNTLLLLCSFLFVGAMQGSDKKRKAQTYIEHENTKKRKKETVDTSTTSTQQIIVAITEKHKSLSSTEEISSPETPQTDECESFEQNVQQIEKKLQQIDHKLEELQTQQSKPRRKMRNRTLPPRPLSPKTLRSGALYDKFVQYYPDTIPSPELKKVNVSPPITPISPYTNVMLKRNSQSTNNTNRLEDEYKGLFSNHLHEYVSICFPDGRFHSMISPHTRTFLSLLDFVIVVPNKGKFRSSPNKGYFSAGTFYRNGELSCVLIDEIQHYRIHPVYEDTYDVCKFTTEQTKEFERHLDLINRKNAEIRSRQAI